MGKREVVRRVDGERGRGWAPDYPTDAALPRWCLAPAFPLPALAASGNALERLLQVGEQIAHVLDPAR